MTVKVTLLDVLLGHRRHGARCMVARAIRRQQPRNTWINVATDRLEVGAHTFELPETVMARIYKWDHWRLVMPFSFELPDLQGA